MPQPDQLNRVLRRDSASELVMSNSCSDLPRKACVSHGVIEMLMSLAVVAIMILSTCSVQM